MDSCHILIPGFHAAHSVDTSKKGECLLPYAHHGYHLNRLRNGKYLSWGGNGCDEYCWWCGECFNYVEISEEEAKAIIADPNKNNTD